MTLGTRRKVIYQHSYMDLPIILNEGEKLLGVHVKAGGAGYGRVLFAKPEPMVLVLGNNVEIADCYFEGVVDCALYVE